MLTANAPAALFDFLETPEAQGAPRWQLEVLASLRWPEGDEPTVETLDGLRRVLAGAARRSADRCAE